MVDGQLRDTVIRTDGVSVSVTLIKRHDDGGEEDGEQTTQKELRKRFTSGGKRIPRNRGELSAVTAAEMQGKLKKGQVVVGVDPGRSKIFTAVDIVVGEHHVVAAPGALRSERQPMRRASSKHWNSELGTSDRQRRERRIRGRAHPVIADYMRTVPSSRRHDWVAWGASWLARLRVLPQLVAYACDKQLRALRFHAYQARQRKTHWLLDRLTGGRNDVVIAFGNGGFSSSSPGFSSGPVRSLRREAQRRGLTLYNTGEFRSSQQCSRIIDHGMCTPGGKVAPADIGDVPAGNTRAARRAKQDAGDSAPICPVTFGSSEGMSDGMKGSATRDWLDRVWTCATR